MELVIRDYQNQAIDSAARDIGKGRTKVLIVAPTASGKSIIQAGIIKRAVARNPKQRFLVLCDQAELLLQNEEKIKMLAKGVSTGVFCADAGRKDTKQQVILASRDSLGRNPEACGEFDGIILDEAHMLSVCAHEEKDDTMYSRILKKLKPKWFIGMTGTPWRLNGGRIWGEGKFFETISYNIPMSQLRDRGFLCPYVFPKLEPQLRGSECRTASTGDFVIKDLEKMASSKTIVNACLDEWERLAPDRRCSLFFCVSRAHAKLVETELMNRIPQWQVAYVDGNTKNREDIYADMRKGVYRAVVSIACLTKGFDAPIIDCIVMLRATKSVSLFIQAIGRALRVFEGKKNALILDFTDNFERFGSIEAPSVKPSGQIKMGLPATTSEKTGKAAVRMCPSCSFECPAQVTSCPYCGEVFISHGTGVFDGSQTKEYFLKSEPTIQDYVTSKGKRCKRICYQLVGGKIVAEYFMIYDNTWSIKKFERRSREINSKDSEKLVGFKGRVSGSLVEIDELFFEDSEIEI